MRRIVFSLVLLWSVAAGARTLAGAATGLNYPWSIYVNLTNNEIGVVNNGNNSITVYSRTATGNASPLRTITGAATLLSGPVGIYVDTTNNEIGVANSGNNKITVYSWTATGNASPLRTITGAATLLNSPVGIYVDTTNNEIGVVNNGNNSITVYSRTATGNAAPCSPSGMLFGPFGEHIKPPNRSRNTAIAKWFDVAHMPNISGVN